MSSSIEDFVALSPEFFRRLRADCLRRPNATTQSSSSLEGEIKGMLGAGARELQAQDKNETAAV